MNKITLKIFLVVLLIGNMWFINGQCLPNGITFYNQETIDNFSTDYSGCSVIEGNVTIHDIFGDITNLNGLSQIVEIQGGLVINSSHQLIDLTGLDNLNILGEGLYISENNNLVNLHGLENLNSVGNLSIRNNDNLTNISNLNIMQINDAISISYNDILSSLNGLENITSINYLLIDNNDSLTNLSGLDGLSIINSGFDILRNDGLIDLSGLDALVYTNYGVISENGSLLTLQGLESLTTINYFYIQLNDQLQDISGLSSLTEIIEFNGIEGRLMILENNMLLSLNGLEGLTAVHGELGIANNNQLSNIGGIRNVDAETITNLYINYNPNLSECAVLSVCDHLDIDLENTYINDNNIGCQTPQEVEAACALDTEENQIAKIKIYPNPTNGSFEISGLKDGTIEIIDSQGRTVKKMDLGERNYSISELTSGIYFVKITSENSSLTKQLIKI
ncbi:MULTISPECIES: T9SS type A sorting domain-containing protein [Aequorivita]|uniref:T9SS type A sorting domain-containing protein n=1 Tax=Aequorivita iocasae TaxID=2803865 RepID=A0ABX7DTD8_9FLAO|nr:MULTISPECIES: T9SS type A sorting domain-containing protein [Aequorivita]QQX76404.1 T9SS type A sorting domain-containing protein [Aequorivita iocasae]UCA55874.1 T9SS type A sorting domain-containing protein [Aequorivita sp. F7]